MHGTINIKLPFTSYSNVVLVNIPLKLIPASCIIFLWLHKAYFRQLDYRKCNAKRQGGRWEGAWGEENKKSDRGEILHRRVAAVRREEDK